MIGDFRDADVWRKAHEFVLTAYRMSHQFPKFEVYALGDQLRRAAVSIPANFAEGFRRRGKADKLRFYNIAEASADECAYYLILIADLGYADTREAAKQLDEVSRMLSAYCRTIRTRRT
ncbi:MAG: four helix bundle protein [Planctomycetota bacterium]